MLMVLVVIFGALVIMAIAAAVNRRRDSLTYRPRTSRSDDGASSWMFVMTGDGGTPLVPVRTQEAVVMVAADVASRISSPS